MNAEPIQRFHCVIPAGGVGTRLWPLSRSAAPKFLHDLTGSGSTLIRATYERLVPIAGGNIMVVTGLAHRASVVAQLPEVEAQNFVFEPDPKDSAAAIGLAAAILFRRNPETIMGSFAADHVISPNSVFHENVREAIHIAATGKIVTIGIRPTMPSTGFGYIRTGNKMAVPGACTAREVVEFVEKPSESTAQEYLANGGYLWNAGMFVAPVSLILEQLQRSEPLLYAGIIEIAEFWDTSKRVAVLEKIWPTLPKIAIDYAVAEPAAKSGDLAVIPGYFQWDDVGDFAAIGRLNPASATTGITALGSEKQVYSKDASGVVVTDSTRVIALIGIDNVVVVDTPDALLVTTMDHAQSVKEAVDSLRNGGMTHVL